MVRWQILRNGIFHMRTKRSLFRYSARAVSVEHLEPRLYLAGDGVVSDQAACLLEVSAHGEAARAPRRSTALRSISTRNSNTSKATCFSRR